MRCSNKARYRRLNAIIARGMAKAPSDRYPSAGALLAAVQDALSDTAFVEPEPPAPPVIEAPVGETPADTDVSPPRGHDDTEVVSAEEREQERQARDVTMADPRRGTGPEQ